MPEVPNPDMVSLGAALFTKKKPLSATYTKESITLGKWFNGSSQQVTEYAIWLSSDVLARWLGYLQAKEQWPSGELDRRWLRLRSEYDKKSLWVVQVASLEKQDPLDMDAPYRPDGLGLEDVSVQINNADLDLHAEELTRFEEFSRHPKEMMEEPWCGMSDRLSLLRPSGISLMEPGPPLGWNRRIVLVLVSDNPIPGTEWLSSVTVRSKGKIRTGKLKLNK